MGQWKALAKVLALSSLRPKHDGNCFLASQHWRPQQGKHSLSFGDRTKLSRPAYAHKFEQLGQVVALGPMGSWYFCASYAAALCLAVPATPLTLSAGYLFGFPMGFFLAVVAGGVAGAICFLLSRTLLRPSLIRLAANNKVFRQMNRAVELEGETMQVDPCNAHF
eukprot:symbB.v1.2.030798.t1/scaffold3509.1/size56090/1